MTPEAALDLLRTLVLFALTVVTPFLLVLLVVGLAASLLQAVTSVQEQLLTFAPKLIALGLMLVVTAPWLLRMFIEFATQCFARMAASGP